MNCMKVNTVSNFLESIENARSCLLDPVNPIQKGVEKIVSEFNATIEKELQDFCKHKGITLEDFLKNARRDERNFDSNYFYDGELILSVVTRNKNLMELKMDDLGTRVEASVYIVPHWKMQLDLDLMIQKSEVVIPRTITTNFNIMTVCCSRYVNGPVIRIFVEKDSQAYVYFWNSNLNKPVRIYYNEKGNVYKVEEV